MIENKEDWEKATVEERKAKANEVCVKEILSLKNAILIGEAQVLTLQVDQEKIRGKGKQPPKPTGAWIMVVRYVKKGSEEEKELTKE